MAKASILELKTISWICKAKSFLDDIKQKWPLCYVEICHLSMIWQKLGGNGKEDNGSTVGLVCSCRICWP